MQTVQRQYKEVGDSYLTRLRSKGDKTTLDITGPQTVMIPHPNNPKMQVPDVGWYLIVTLEHKMMLGEDEFPLYAGIPIKGALLPEEHIKKGIALCWEQIQKIKAERENPESKTNAAAFRAQGNVVPEGKQAPPVREEKPRAKRERERERVSHFPSKKGSGFTDE